MSGWENGVDEEAIVGALNLLEKADTRVTVLIQSGPDEIRNNSDFKFMADDLANGILIIRKALKK